MDKIEWVERSGAEALKSINKVYSGHKVDEFSSELKESGTFSTYIEGAKLVDEELPKFKQYIMMPFSESTVLKANMKPSTGTSRAGGIGTTVMTPAPRR